MAKPGKISKPSKKRQEAEPEKPLTDERFSSAYKDPKFRAPKLKDFKVKVDERFSRKELSKLNEGVGGRKVKIDRYGRRVGSDDKIKDFEKYLKHSDEEDEVEGSGSLDSEDEEEGEDSEASEASEASDGSESDSGASESDKEESSAKSKSLKQNLDRARGEGLESSDESEDSEETEESSDDDSDSDASVDVESEVELEDGKPQEGDPTNAFAVVNMDWDNLRAIDLMATLSSFVPSGGVIKSVTIYPSEFGKARMQKEEVEGPPRELFKSKSKKQKTKDEEESSDSEVDLQDEEGMKKAAQMLYQEDNGKEDYDSKALRRYQLQRLRYYYAVVKCDSVATAKNIYDNCDGTEYESTANIFDLRYVPSDMEFDDEEATDTCTKIPSNYRPSNFVTDALQHSKVKLTWDETPRERLNLASRLFSQKEIDEMDFKAYLASDSEEEDKAAEVSTAKNKYKDLIGLRFLSSGPAKADDDDVDLEISFKPGLDDEKFSEDEKKEESTIDAYKRKEKERRKRRLEKFKQAQEAGSTTQTEALNLDKKLHKKSAKDTAADFDQKSRQELELVMMDEEANNDDHHFNMREIVKAEKLKNKNKNKNKKNKTKSNSEDQPNFNPDLNDPRFDEVFENHEYAIDPTSSEFKKTDTMNKILKERSKRSRSSFGTKKRAKNTPISPQINSKNNLASLVSKLKTKLSK